ncbi:MAG: BatD family protein, partial [Endomicrobium sp.]|nr:BatD family protein [Endomicrobium sp.]
MFRKLIILVLLFISVMTYANDIFFRAFVDKTTVPLNESFIYSITVNGDSTNLPEHKIGAMDEFYRFGTATSKSMSIINGKTSMSVTYNYTLGPKRIGKFKIPPAKMTFNGKSYLTESIEIEVTAAQSVHSQNTQSVPVKNKQSQSLNQSSQNQPRKAFVKASINKRTAYENEKLIYKFSFYTN